MQLFSWGLLHRTTLSLRVAQSISHWKQFLLLTVMTLTSLCMSSTWMGQLPVSVSYCSNCQGLVISDVSFTSQWSFPFPSQQLAMTIHLVRTLWTSLLVNCMPPWWCLPLTTTQQSYQSTSVWRLSPLTNQMLLWLSHPARHSSLLKIMTQVCNNLHHIRG